MKTIIKKWIEKYGYSPSIYELHTLYTEGSLNLTNSEENALLSEFEKTEGLH
jgi:hypothetical protein